MAQIMVVDDEEDVVPLIKLMLSDYDVVGLSDGRLALEQCKADPPDLLIVDVFMPDLDGLEFINAIRKSLPDVPIIAMSGGGAYQNMTALEAARHITSAVLTKPFPPLRLRQTVEKLLGT